MSLEIINQTPLIPDLFRERASLIKLPDNFPGLNLISRKEASRNPDLIFVDQGVNLPEGMTEADIRDCLNLAREFEGQNISFIVYVKEEVESDGHPLAGRSRFLGLSWSGLIELSVAGVRKNNTAPFDLPGYTPARASQQMWAVAFEEALHCARQAAGKDQGNYFTLPANPTEEDRNRYFLQEQEAAVDKVLNGGVLESKFGKGTIYLSKRVLHEVPVSNYLNVKADDNKFIR